MWDKQWVGVGKPELPQEHRSSNLAPVLETLVNGGTTMKSSPNLKVGIFNVLQGYLLAGCEKKGKKTLGQCILIN